MHTGTQLFPPQPVSLNCLPFRRFRHFPRTTLILMMLIEKQSGIRSADRLPAKVIENNLDAAAVKLNQPAQRRRTQIKLKVADWKPL